MVKIIGMETLKTKKHILLFLIMATSVLLLIGCRQIDLRDQLMSYCEKHDEIKLSDVTDFEWDIAYTDRQHYMHGEGIKEKYNIEGELKELPTDFSTRVVFCKNGIIVYDLILNDCYLEFDSSIEVISIDSVFKITWAEEKRSPSDERGRFLRLYKN